MRYCNKTKEIINSSYKSATVAEIKTILKANGLRKRSESSLTKYINNLVQKDQKREIRRKKTETWALSNPIKYRARTLVNGAKQRAKKKNIPFNLTYEWVENKLRNGACEVTNTSFYIKPYSTRLEYVKVHPHSPSLDQISPSGGYTMDNVQVVCDQVNKFKGDRPEASMVIIARNFLKSYERRNTPVVKA
tara:strand:+ start:976 stop:1548 length:573 start_codon:yes stop_codon:yes gene_type:complete